MKGRTFLHKHEHPLDSTGQLVKIPRNHHRISDNLQMTCKRRVLACRNRWSGKSDNWKISYNPNGGGEFFTVFRENGLGISTSRIIKSWATVVWSFRCLDLLGRPFFRLRKRLCPGVPVHRGNNHCTLLFTNLCLAVEHCWVFCIGSCEPVHEDRTA